MPCLVAGNLTEDKIHYQEVRVGKRGIEGVGVGMGRGGRGEKTVAKKQDWKRPKRGRWNGESTPPV